MVTNKVEHGTDCLAHTTAKSAAQLLQKQSGAVGGTQHQESINGRDVHPLVKEIDRKHDVDSPCRKIAQRGQAFRIRRVGPDRRGINTGGQKDPRHESRMFNANAEPQRPHAT